MCFVTRTGVDEAVHRGNRRLVLRFVADRMQRDSLGDDLEMVGERGGRRRGSTSGNPMHRTPYA